MGSDEKLWFSANRPATVVILLLVLISFSVKNLYYETWWINWNPIAVDFTYFWRAARLPLSALYPSNLFVYPPTGIALLEPFRWLPRWNGFLIWTVVSVTMFFLVARKLVGTKAAALSLLSMPVLFGVLLGQTLMILSSIILFAITLPSIIGGFILGVVLVVKPQLLIMTPVILAVRRDWSALGFACLGACTVLLGATAYYGIGMWIAWLTALPAWQLILIEHRVFDHTITLSGLAMRWELPTWPWLLCGIAISFFAAIKLSKKVEGAGLVALMVSCSALASPYALPHDLIGAMPALAVAIIAASGALEIAFGACFFSGFFLPILLPVAAFVGAQTGSFPIPKLRNSAVTARDGSLP